MYFLQFLMSRGVQAITVQIIGEFIVAHPLHDWIIFPALKSVIGILNV